MNEFRKYVRTKKSVMVSISHPSIGHIDLKAKDLSDGGMFIFFGQNSIPPVGTVLSVIIKRHSGLINSEPVEMKVVHHQQDGVGLTFIR